MKQSWKILKGLVVPCPICDTKWIAEHVEWARREQIGLKFKCPVCKKWIILIKFDCRYENQTEYNLSYFASFWENMEAFTRFHQMFGDLSKKYPVFYPPKAEDYYGKSVLEPIWNHPKMYDGLIFHEDFKQLRYQAIEGSKDSICKKCVFNKGWNGEFYDCQKADDVEVKYSKEGILNGKIIACSDFRDNGGILDDILRS